MFGTRPTPLEAELPDLNTVERRVDRSNPTAGIARHAIPNVM
jgi:hypothetical protein